MKTSIRAKTLILLVTREDQVKTQSGAWAEIALRKAHGGRFFFFISPAATFLLMNFINLASPLLCGREPLPVSGGRGK